MRLCVSEEKLQNPIYVENIEGLRYLSSPAPRLVR